MRKFFLGAVLGALLAYVLIHYAPGWVQRGGGWLERAASQYRGDAKRKVADEALR
jgi:hypothetical protein